MQFIKPDINLNFTGKKNIGFLFSLSLIIISFAFLIINHGPNYGIDFTGGTLVQVKFTEKIAIKTIRTGLSDLGLSNVSVQNFGKKEDNEFLIRTKKSIKQEDLSLSISKAFKKLTGIAPEIRRIEMVGPQVGKELRKKALLAMFYSLLFITIYISGRFEMKWILSGITAGSTYECCIFSFSF